MQLYYEKLTIDSNGYVYTNNLGTLNAILLLFFPVKCPIEQVYRGVKCKAFLTVTTLLPHGKTHNSVHLFFTNAYSTVVLSFKVQISHVFI